MSNSFEFAETTLESLRSAFEAQSSAFSPPLDYKVQCYEEVSSTMDIARNTLCEEVRLEPIKPVFEFIHPLGRSEHSTHVFIARSQSQGRGRDSRHWLSDAGKGLYVTLAFPWKGNPSSMSGLSLAAGVGVMRVLGSHPGLGLKWPNDVVVRGKDTRWSKLGGILVEVASCKSETIVLLGLGINLYPGETDEQVSRISIADLEKISISFPDLAAAVICSEMRVMGEFRNLGFAGFRSEWEEYSQMRDARVTFRRQNELRNGIVLGVAEDGALRVREEGGLGGEQKLYSGDVEFFRATGN